MALTAGIAPRISDTKASVGSKISENRLDDISTNAEHLEQIASDLEIILDRIGVPYLPAETSAKAVGDIAASNSVTFDSRLSAETDRVKQARYRLSDVRYRLGEFF